MTLPQATALQFKALHPTAAEILAYAASRKDKWFSPQTAPRKSPRIIEAPVAGEVVATPPEPRVWREQHNSHIGAWLEWKGNAPLGYLKLRCRETDVAYADIVGGSQKRIHSDPRARLMADVKIMFPEITLAEMGRLFRKDHTSCLKALRKHGVISNLDGTRNRPSDRQAARVYALLMEGKSYREIGEIVGFSYTTVHRILGENGWLGLNPRRSAGDHADSIREMFDAGAGLKVIAEAFGFSRSHVTAFVRTQGWKR